MKENFLAKKENKNKNKKQRSMNWCDYKNHSRSLISKTFTVSINIPFALELCFYS